MAFASSCRSGIRSIWFQLHNAVIATEGRIKELQTASAAKEPIRDGSIRETDGRGPLAGCGAVSKLEFHISKTKLVELPPPPQRVTSRWPQRNAESANDR
jgi:hypothetical protein